MPRRRQELEFARKLFDNLLECTQSAAGKIGIQRERVVVQVLLKAIVTSYRATNGVELELLIPTGAIYAEVDATRIQQLLRNLTTML